MLPRGSPSTYKHGIKDSDHLGMAWDCLDDAQTERDTNMGGGGFMNILCFPKQIAAAYFFLIFYCGGEGTWMQGLVNLVYFYDPLKLVTSDCFNLAISFQQINSKWQTTGIVSQTANLKWQTARKIVNWHLSFAKLEGQKSTYHT